MIIWNQEMRKKMSRSINIYLSIYQSNLYSIAQFHISGIMKMNVFHTFFFIIEKFLLIVTTHTQTRITRFNALYRLHLSKGNRNDSDIKLENKMKWKNKRNSAELRQKKIIVSVKWKKNPNVLLHSGGCKWSEKNLCNHCSMYYPHL